MCDKENLISDLPPKKSEKSWEFKKKRRKQVIYYHQLFSDCDVEI